MIAAARRRRCAHTRARRVRPLRCAASSEAMMIAAAPSFTPEALPA
jgi:hypothetical protein